MLRVLDAVSPGVLVAAQNAWKEPKGAYTGEVSVEQLRESGVRWVILGHSERRSIFAEGDALVGEKSLVAVRSGLSVVFCCGELLEERKGGTTLQVVIRQLSPLKGLKPEEWKKIVIAYEPVWAIGTGVVATPEQAQETHRQIRQWLADQVSPEVAQTTRIIYGGSVNGKNCLELARQPDIDGFLVGGASLKADEFITICLSGQQAKSNL
uniref:Triosephosphate isomerase n=1 Tax=Arcella intermedia TaxID=1963864 RepID=A0A6B2LEZ1_9EUKA